MNKTLLRNILVVAAVVILIGAVALIAGSQQRTLNPTGGQLAADPTATAAAVTATPTAEPAATPAAESTATSVPAVTAAPSATRAPAEAYLVVTAGGVMYEPIPLHEAGRYTIRQGEEMVNVIEVSRTSICMYSSTCDNQDCVEQGVVSLENRADRVLQNMIICLPNEVALELYTPEEVTDLLLGLVASAEDNAAEAPANE